MQFKTRASRTGKVRRKDRLVGVAAAAAACEGKATRFQHFFSFFFFLVESAELRTAFIDLQRFISFYFKRCPVCDEGADRCVWETAGRLVKWRFITAPCATLCVPSHSSGFFKTIFLFIALKVSGDDQKKKGDILASLRTSA